MISAPPCAWRALPSLTPAVVAPGEWHHYIVAIDATGGCAVYVDGALVSTALAGGRAGAGGVRVVPRVHTYLGKLGVGDPRGVFLQGSLSDFQCVVRFRFLLLSFWVVKRPSPTPGVFERKKNSTNAGAALAAGSLWAPRSAHSTPPTWPPGGAAQRRHRSRPCRRPRQPCRRHPRRHPRRRRRPRHRRRRRRRRRPRACSFLVFCALSRTQFVPHWATYTPPQAGQGGPTKPVGIGRLPPRGPPRPRDPPRGPRELLPRRPPSLTARSTASHARPALSSCCAQQGGLPTLRHRLSAPRRSTLNSNGLVGVIPPSIGQLSHLAVLCVRPSEGFPWPSGSWQISHLPSTHSFAGSRSLSYNALSGSVPPSIASLTTLVWLVLISNSLTGELPATMPASLQILSLASNRLSGSLPATIGSLTALQQMCVRGAFFLTAWSFFHTRLPSQHTLRKLVLWVFA